MIEAASVLIWGKQFHFFRDFSEPVAGDPVVHLNRTVFTYSEGGQRVFRIFYHCVSSSVICMFLTSAYNFYVSVQAVPRPRVTLQVFDIEQELYQKFSNMNFQSRAQRLFTSASARGAEFKNWWLGQYNFPEIFFLAQQLYRRTSL